MNIAMPSIVIKMMRQKFDQQWSVRKTHASMAEQARVLRLLRESNLSLEARLEGPTVTVQDLLSLSEGNLLVFDYPVERSIELLVNGSRKYTAQVVASGKRRGCAIEQVRKPAGQGRISEEGAGAGELSRSE
jgi:flagellar motor switch protein FliM